MRRHPQIDPRGANSGLAGPVADEGARAHLHEFDHAECGFMRVDRVRKQRRNQQQDGADHCPRHHGSYRTR